MKALVDGDIIVYRAGFAVEKTKYLVQEGASGLYTPLDTAKEAKELANEVDDVIWSRKDLKPVEEAYGLVDAILGDIGSRYGAPVVYLSPSLTFRDRIARRAKYKGNRDTNARPTHATPIRQHLIDCWDAGTAVDEEADDAIGIALTKDPTAVVVSNDKDLDQLAGKHFDWTTKTEYVVTPLEATRFFYQQCMSGDATDNVPGLEGIGKKRAESALKGVKSHKEAWGIVLDAYINLYADDGPLFALETARLVYIRRQENELWNPPK